jgi:hypothetical protein
MMRLARRATLLGRVCPPLHRELEEVPARQKLLK